MAAVEVFPGIASEGCFFHFSKRLDYHVKSLGLIQTSESVCRNLLPWPPFLLLTSYPPLSPSPPSSCRTSFLSWLTSRTWIGTPVGATRRLTPDFPIQMWNALEMSAAVSTRTTNAFNTLISCQHQYVWNFLESLRNQQALTANTMRRIQRGCFFQPRPTDAAMNTRIVNLITSYTRATADSFLRGIAFNYMF